MVIYKASDEWKRFGVNKERPRKGGADLCTWRGLFATSFPLARW